MILLTTKQYEVTEIETTVEISSTEYAKMLSAPTTEDSVELAGIFLDAAYAENRYTTQKTIEAVMHTPHAVQIDANKVQHTYI